MALHVGLKSTLNKQESSYFTILLSKRSNFKLHHIPLLDYGFISMLATVVEGDPKAFLFNSYYTKV